MQIYCRFSINQTLKPSLLFYIFLEGTRVIKKYRIHKIIWNNRKNTSACPCFSIYWDWAVKSLNGCSSINPYLPFGQQMYRISSSWKACVVSTCNCHQISCLILSQPECLLFGQINIHPCIHMCLLKKNNIVFQPLQWRLYLSNRWFRITVTIPELSRGWIKDDQFYFLGENQWCSPPLYLSIFLSENETPAMPSFNQENATQKQFKNTWA